MREVTGYSRSSLTASQLCPVGCTSVCPGRKYIFYSWGTLGSGAKTLNFGEFLNCNTACFEVVHIKQWSFRESFWMLWKLSQLQMLHQVPAPQTSPTSCATGFPCTYGQNLCLIISSAVSYASNSFTYSSRLLGQGLFIAVPKNTAQEAFMCTYNSKQRCLFQGC